MTNLKKHFSATLMILLVLLLIPTSSYAFTSTDADYAMNSFNSAFYTGGSGSYNYKADTGGGLADFWKEAEMIEMVEDAYQRSGNVTYKNMITELYNGFVARFGTDWSGNIYNDDLIWMCIACLRAYEITGNTTFRDRAKANFDTVWNRGYDGSLGGGIWWTTAKTSKNTCINAPATIAAYKLYQALGDSAYLTKANSLFSWVKSKLYNSSTGSVYDNISSGGSVVQTNYTYNAGTFIGSCHLLGDTTNGTKALDYAKNNLVVGAAGGIMRSERATSDQGGFKGIFWRWACKYVKDRGLGGTYNSWFQLNANLAWANRDTSRNIKDENIMSKTGSGTVTSWGCSSTVVLMQVCPAGGSAPTVVTFYQDANYGGAAYTLLKGNYPDTNPTGIPNDWVSSLRNPGGWTVALYQNGNYAGTVWTFTTDTTYVGAGCNDQMSSLRIY